MHYGVHGVHFGVHVASLYEWVDESFRHLHADRDHTISNMSAFGLHKPSPKFTRLIKASGTINPRLATIPTRSRIRIILAPAPTDHAATLIKRNQAATAVVATALLRSNTA